MPAGHKGAWDRATGSEWRRTLSQGESVTARRRKILMDKWDSVGQLMNLHQYPQIGSWTHHFSGSVCCITELCPGSSGGYGEDLQWADSVHCGTVFWGDRDDKSKGADGIRRGTWIYGETRAGDRRVQEERCWIRHACTPWWNSVPEGSVRASRHQSTCHLWFWSKRVYFILYYFIEVECLNLIGCRTF